LERRQPPGSAGGREHTSPADDPTLLLGWVEEHEGGVGDADDRGQGGGVWVVDHDSAGLGIDPLPQAGGVARQRQRSSRSRLDDTTAVEQLAPR
jgi:hypothetical protein